jgi:hypothetical protein
MRSEVFVACDFAQDERGKLSLMGAFDAIVFRSFPAQCPLMCVAARIRFMIHELGRHSVRIEILDPNGGFVIPPFEKEISLDSIGDDSGAADAVLQLTGLRFAGPGKHALRLLVDGAELASAPLYVRAAR